MSSKGKHNAGVVPVIKYSHFSSSVTVSKTFSVPQIKSSCERLLGTAVAKETKLRYLHAARWPVPALCSVTVHLCGVIFFGPFFYIRRGIPRRKFPIPESESRCAHRAPSRIPHPRLNDDPPWFGFCLASSNRHTSYT